MADKYKSTFTGNQLDTDAEEGLNNQQKINAVWSEVSQSFVGQNLFTNAGRVDYNFTDLTLDFSDNARYPNEPVGIVLQFPHERKSNSEIRPHIHWMPTSAIMPNILIEYRKCNNGGVYSSWEQKALVLADNKFTYSAGIQQITEFNIASDYGDDLGISATFECKIYRDSANTSGLFAGADTYSGSVNMKYYDVHFQIDQMGSREEFVK